MGQSGDLTLEWRKLWGLEVVIDLGVFWAIRKRIGERENKGLRKI